MLLPRHVTAPVLPPPPGSSNNTVPLRLCRDCLDYVGGKRGSVDDEIFVLPAELFERKHILRRESGFMNA